MSSNTSSSLLPFHAKRFIPSYKHHQKPQIPYKVSCISKSNNLSTLKRDDIVIIGAGIAGLATALALHRLGISSLVLEQSDSLGKGGTSLTLFKNGWRALDVLGVGNQLRSQFLEIQGLSINTDDKKQLRSFEFKNVDPSQEVRAVEKRVLLQTFADELPPDSVQFSSKLASMEADHGTGETKLELTNGDKLSAKIVIGCDGSRSQVAQWMGFSEPKYAGHCTIRGLAVYRERQPFQPRGKYMYGRGIRVGFVPVSSTKVYWLICYNSSTPGPKVSDPSEVKRRAFDIVKNWSFDMLSAMHQLIDLTPEDSIAQSAHEDRWLWPILTPPVSKGKVVPAGDAWHPMTPNLGQGGCCALEDAIVLAKKLSQALSFGQGSIEDAMRSYGDERWRRVFLLTIRDNLVGKLLQWENPVYYAVRNSFIIPKVPIGSFLEHTNFLCEPL